jgi:DNA-binding PadR family transcriptional regulator
MVAEHHGGGTMRRRGQALYSDKYETDLYEMGLNMANLVAVEDHLPLKPVVFHILLALAEGDAHGYGVIRSVRSRSGGRIPLTTGAFYRHLAKLLDARLVEESAHRPEDDDPRRGAYYAITTLGREVVAADGKRLQELIAATARLGLLDGGPG